MVERIRVGTVGWNYPAWKGLLYPDHANPSDFLKRYAERFPIVESASSYYGMPKTQTAAHWADETQAGFEISLKVPAWILKTKPDDPDLARALGVFLGHLEPLRAAGKLGTLVAQFPPFFRRDKRAIELAAFVRTLPKGPRWAVELRHPSWWHSETYRMLSDAGVTLVWSALGGEARTPAVLTTDAIYLRIFGDRELEEPFDRKRRDGRAELSHWVARIEDEGRDAKRVDVLVSKYLEGYAPGTAATLCDMLDIQVPDIGPREGRTDPAGKPPPRAKPKQAEFPTTWRF